MTAKKRQHPRQQPKRTPREGSGNERLARARTDEGGGALVVAFGEVLWDLYERPNGLLERHVGGASANLAVTLARVGVDAALVGAVGKDALGDELARRISAEGVDVSALVQNERRTGIAFVLHEPHAFVGYRAGTAETVLSAREVTRGVAAVGAHARFAVVGTVAAGVLAPDATVAFVRAARKVDAALVLDLNARPHVTGARGSSRARDAVAPLVAHAALIKASEHDLETYPLAWIARHADPHASIVVTRGAEPATVLDGTGFQVSVAARPKTRVVDGAGGGDAFLAGVLSMLLAVDVVESAASWDKTTIWTQALGLGHSLGAQAVSRVGATSGVRGTRRRA